MKAVAKKTEYVLNFFECFIFTTKEFIATLRAKVEGALEDFPIFISVKIKL
jgi:hypothetical protein